MNVFRQFIEEKVAPEADRWDRDQAIPREFLDTLSDFGIWGAAIGEEFGGRNFSEFEWGEQLELLGFGSMSLLSIVTVHTMCAQAIGRWGDPDQKKQWLPKLATGEILGAFALSEPKIGSDAKNVESSLKSGNGDFKLNGKKRWISGAQIADLFLTFIQSENGPSAILLPRNSNGFEITPINEMLGFRAAMLGELDFQNVSVSSDQILGSPGIGFSHVTNMALDAGRFCIAAGCTGLIRASLRASVDYAQNRKQFGVALREHQLIQELIAEMATGYKASRALWRQAAELREKFDPRSISETTIAKYFASRAASRAASDAVQIHGANGCSSDFPVQRFFRDARIGEIIEGSNQMQQIMIAQAAFSEFRTPRKRRGYEPAN